MTKFEVGGIYFNVYKEESIQVSKRTKKTIWFLDDAFSARIKIKNGVETITPNIGIVRKTYYANLKYN